MRLWDGAPMPPGLRQRVLRVYAHHQCLREQIAEVEAERRALLHDSTDASIDKMRQFMLLKGIGITGSWLFGRARVNRRAVGGLAGSRRRHIKVGRVHGNKGSASRATGMCAG